MEKVRFGIIGVGNMGSGHFRSFINNKVENDEIKIEKKENLNKIVINKGTSRITNQKIENIQYPNFKWKRSVWMETG